MICNNSSNSTSCCCCGGRRQRCLSTSTFLYWYYFTSSISISSSTIALTDRRIIGIIASSSGSISSITDLKYSSQDLTDRHSSSTAIVAGAGRARLSSCALRGICTEPSGVARVREETGTGLGLKNEQRWCWPPAVRVTQPQAREKEKQMHKCSSNSI